MFVARFPLPPDQPNKLNKSNIFSFWLLTDETVKEVIPKLGIRLKFMSLHRAEVRYSDMITIGFQHVLRHVHWREVQLT